MYSKLFVELYRGTAVTLVLISIWTFVCRANRSDASVDLYYWLYHCRRRCRRRFGRLFRKSVRAIYFGQLFCLLELYLLGLLASWDDRPEFYHVCCCCCDLVGVKLRVVSFSGLLCPDSKAECFFLLFLFAS